MSQKEVVLGTLAWVIRRISDPLGVRRFRPNPALAEEDLPGLDPTTRQVGSIPAK